MTSFFPLDFTVVAVDRDEGRLLLAALERDFVAGFVELLVAFGAVLPRGVTSSGIVSLGAATVAAGWIASCQAGGNLTCGAASFKAPYETQLLSVKLTVTHLLGATGVVLGASVADAPLQFKCK